MSKYWKQSLIIGGIYWLFSLILVWQGSWAALITDCILSVLLLLFLLPLNKLVPIKRIDKMMVKHPIVATMLASVGWIPYFTAVLAIVASVVVLIDMEYMEKVMTIVVGMGILRSFLAGVIVFVTLVAVLVYGKSIAGQLDDSYKVMAVQKANALVKTTVVKNEQVVARNVRKVKEKKVDVKKTIKKAKVQKAKAEPKKSVAGKDAVKAAPKKKTTAKNLATKKKEVTGKKTTSQKTAVKKSPKKVVDKKTTQKKTSVKKKA